MAEMLDEETRKVCNCYNLLIGVKISMNKGAVETVMLKAFLMRIL